MQNYKVIQKNDYLVVGDVDYNFNNLDENIKNIEIWGDFKTPTRSIINLHHNVKYLHIERCKIDSIDFLPMGLEKLELMSINKSNLDNLPLSLKQLCVYYNKIDNLNNLPPNLEYLIICSCNILNKNISNLPKNLKKIHIFTKSIPAANSNVIPNIIEKEDITPPNDYCVIEVIN